MSTYYNRLRVWCIGLTHRLIKFTALLVWTEVSSGISIYSSGEKIKRLLQIYSIIINVIWMLFFVIYRCVFKIIILWFRYLFSELSQFVFIIKSNKYPMLTCFQTVNISQRTYFTYIAQKWLKPPVKSDVLLCGPFQHFQHFPIFKI